MHQTQARDKRGCSRDEGTCKGPEVGKGSAHMSDRISSVYLEHRVWSQKWRGAQTESEQAPKPGFRAHRFGLARWHLPLSAGEFQTDLPGGTEDSAVAVTRAM